MADINITSLSSHIAHKRFKISVLQHFKFSVVRGNASCSYIDKIRSLQKRALQKPLFSHIKLMWDYDHGTIPPSLNVLFRRTNTVHNYKTRGAAGGNFYYTKLIPQNTVSARLSIKEYIF